MFITHSKLLATTLKPEPNYTHLSQNFSLVRKISSLKHIELLSCAGIGMEQMGCLNWVNGFGIYKKNMGTVQPKFSTK